MNEWSVRQTKKSSSSKVLVNHSQCLHLRKSQMVINYDENVLSHQCVCVLLFPVSGIFFSNKASM